MRALISTYDKTGLVPFARGLVDLGFELVASGGTAAALEEGSLPVTRVESVTGFPELLEGRVKTLHPRIHAAILARRDRDEDLAALAEHGIVPFDLVCVNLYPFEQVVGGLDVSDELAVEMIDVGGPALLRAAAKNRAHVAVVCRPEDYEGILAELRLRGRLSEASRRRLAATAFATTAAYDAAIARWFQRDEPFPETFVPAFTRVAELAYGENPHQRAAFYAERGARTHVLSRVEQLHGKALSFNNLADLSAARLLALELERPACVIVKHANPCGVAVADTIEEAYAGALAADPVSAYGGVVVLNRPVGPVLGEELARQFVEVLLAPEYDEQALAALRRREGVRILRDAERRALTPAAERDYRRVLGGLLVQERDAWGEGRENMQVVCGSVAEGEWDDVLFAWRVAKHLDSNAIAIVRDGRTLGLGAGQTSRVDAVRIALAKARAFGHDLAGSVLASDAFFPFADGPQLALEAGVRVLVQPGGSKRDEEVVRAVADAGAAMIFTHRRHFRH
ncbi:MAG TPA: bifunctional phosphoribosylaminoimidazolecarboxamide formyltransferase/IMP cyclohydrolase [Gaiellaceae bacterium]|nr:bifunctional phosphoribosylaminoimidazolecarboxamide formyltransferase/IMP cyclohydrolase [Gaiellaceae bacterium]